MPFLRKIEGRNGNLGNKSRKAKSAFLDQTIYQAIINKKTAKFEQQKNAPCLERLLISGGQHVLLDRLESPQR